MRRLLLHLVAMAVVGISAEAALAHAFLDQAAPPVDGTVPASPKEIRLTFSEGVEPRFSFMDALDNIHKLDDAFFRGLVTRAPSRLDLLAAPDGGDATRLDSSRVRTLLEFASKHFEFTVVDDACAGRRAPLTEQRWVYVES